MIPRQVGPIGSMPGAVYSYVPVLTAVSSNPTLGTGSSQIGMWARIGNLVFVWAQIKFGTSPTAGSGEYRFSLPAPYDAKWGDAGVPIGAGVFASGGGAGFFSITVVAAGNDTSNARLQWDSASTDFLSSAESVAVAGNYIAIQAVYPTP